jgi:hypothetical protein
LSDELPLVDELEGDLPSLEDRRKHNRSRLIIDVFFAGADETGIAHTTDISPGGLYMKTHAEIPEGALVMLRIPLGHESQIMVNARVIYVSPGYGVGVRFEGIADEDRILLETALAAMV